LLKRPARLLRCLVAKRRVWPDRVVIVAPQGQLAPCIVQAVEYFLVQELVAQAPVEALDEGVLLRISGVDVVPRHLVFIGPFQMQGMAEAAQLWVGPAPTLTNQPPPDELEQMLHIAKKFDVAARDERNRALGKAGEERVLKHERDTLTAAGREDLAQQIRWVSEEDGDGAGYDIASFDADGRQRLIEVKTTNGWERTPFHISRNDLPWQMNGARNGACFASGTSHERPRLSSCARRLMRMCRSRRPVFRQAFTE
jgi:hypothetical protein